MNELSYKEPKEDVIQQADPLTLDIDDQKLATTITKRVALSKTYYKGELNLYERQKKNEKYLFGQQIDEMDLKKYNARFVDNIIYEAEASIKPIALSRLPDLIVKAGTDQQQSKDSAKKLSTILTSDIKQRKLRQVLGLAFRHLPVYFIGAIKYRWDPEKGDNGDYVFEVVQPENLVLDHTCPSNDANDMDFVAETLQLTIKELVMRFPEKEEEILNAAGIGTTDSNKEDRMATKIKFWEVWFTWWDKATDGGWKRIEGVAWKYKNVLLKKMKNPNWDWEGEERSFVFDTDKKTKRDPTETELKGAMIANTMGDQQALPSQKYFHNHFENPEKPYIFIGYDQWGKMPYDATSRIEQCLWLQDNVNKRGKQITETIDRMRGKNVFSTDAGLKKEDVEDLDMDDPTTDLLVEGNVSEVFTRMPGDPINQFMVQDQEINRERVFAKEGVHSTTRGQKETNVATTSQILREADFGRIDDLTEDTINYAAEKIANAAMQMIKLRYTEDHFRRLIGKDGEVMFERLNRDLIEDGMEVQVSASGVDKLMRKRQAFEMAKMQLIDPLTFYEDTDMSSPKDRTERLMTFMSDKNTYLTKYVMSLDTTEKQVGALENQPVPGGNPQTGLPAAGGGQATGGGSQGGGAQQAATDIMMMQQGQMPPQPNNPDPQYIKTMDNFLKSPEFQQMTPENQGMVVQFAKQLIGATQDVAGQLPAGGGLPAGV